MNMNMNMDMDMDIDMDMEVDVDVDMDMDMDMDMEITWICGRAKPERLNLPVARHSAGLCARVRAVPVGSAQDKKAA